MPPLHGGSVESIDWRAGGMIMELEELWESELVPLLKAELAEELSVEQRIVNASLRCVDKSQRAGVEALFGVFGCCSSL